VLDVGPDVAAWEVDEVESLEHDRKKPTQDKLPPAKRLTVRCRAMKAALHPDPALL
jgi:hypothetical protein